MFAALGTGIACGSYVFLIAIMGTLFFSFVAICLKFTPFHMGNHVIWELRVRIEDRDKIPAMEQVFEKYCRRSTLDDIRNEPGKNSSAILQEREYFLILRDDDDNLELLQAIESLGGIMVRRLSKQSVVENALVD